MTDKNHQLETLLKWGLGGFILWNLLPPEGKNNIANFTSQLNAELAIYQRQLALEEHKQRLRNLIGKLPLNTGPIDTRSLGIQPLQSEQAPPRAIICAFSSSSKRKQPVIPVSPPLVPDAEWRKKIIHPSIVLILGKRGSGKSALAYRLLELFRYGPEPYVVAVPSTARSILPDWIGIVSNLEELPSKTIAVIDEAYLRYHARGSLAQESKAMSQIINLSRQKEQTIVFVTQEARQVDRNIVSSANVIVFKDLGMLQLQFDRPELNQLATQAREAFNAIKGSRHHWSYVYAPDADFQGLIENELPSFWKPGLSRAFAFGVDTPVVRAPRKLTTEDKIQKAREMRAQGASYSAIAQFLGVTKGSIVNYLKGYPYRA